LARASFSNTLGVGAALHTLPLSSVARLQAAWAADGDGDCRLLSGSLGRLLVGGLLASASTTSESGAPAVRLRTGWVVHSLSLDEGRVTCTAVDGLRILARAACIAVPVTVLQRDSIRFSPPLSAEKRAALASIRMAGACKLIVRLSGSIWAHANSAAPKVHSLLCANALVPELWLRELANGHWLVSGFSTGDSAEALAALPLADALDGFLVQIAARLPGCAGVDTLRSRVAGVWRVDWASEEHVWGGYSSPSFAEAPGARAEYRRGEWGGALRFAGEASEEGSMTMSAALSSGQRAAVELRQWAGTGAG
jgi:monoamine oxidase